MRVGVDPENAGTPDRKDAEALGFAPTRRLELRMITSNGGVARPSRNRPHLAGPLVKAKRRLLLLFVPVIAVGSIGAAARPPVTTFSDAPGSFTLSCPSATFQAAAKGTGTFAPARAVDGTRAFVPAEFGPSTIRGEDSTGQLWVGHSPFTVSKGQSTHADSVRCSFSWTIAGGGAGFPTWTETTTGGVVGTLSGAG